MRKYRQGDHAEAGALLAVPGLPGVVHRRHGNSDGRLASTDADVVYGDLYYCDKQQEDFLGEARRTPGHRAKDGMVSRQAYPAHDGGQRGITEGDR